MHRPDADPHCSGATAQPSEADPPACGGYASRKVEGGVRRCDGDQYRPRHLAVVVGAGQGLACRDHHKRSPLPVWVSLYTLRTNPLWIVRPRTHRRQCTLTQSGARPMPPSHRISRRDASRRVSGAEAPLSGGSETPGYITASHSRTLVFLAARRTAVFVRAPTSRFADISKLTLGRARWPGSLIVRISCSGLLFYKS